MANKITPQQRADITAQNIETFKRQCPDFYPCPANAYRLTEFLESQLGSNEGKFPEYDYPYTVENVWAAYDYAKKTGILIQRPESEESIARREAAARIQAAEETQELRDRQTQKAYDRRDSVTKEEDRLRALPVNERNVELKTMPIKQLGQLATRQRHRLAGEREAPKVNQESRELSPERLSQIAVVRSQVAAANPGLSRTSEQFTRLVAEIMQANTNAPANIKITTPASKRSQEPYFG